MSITQEGGVCVPFHRAIKTQSRCGETRHLDVQEPIH